MPQRLAASLSAGRGRSRQSARVDGRIDVGRERCAAEHVHQSPNAAERFPPYDSRASRLSPAMSSTSSDTLTLTVLFARSPAFVLPESGT
jgi:hypothetical protein